MHCEFVIEQPLNRIGDFQLAAFRRLDRFRGVEDVLVEHIHADECQVGFRLRRLFGQPHHATVVGKLRHAELRWVGHLRQQDLAVAVERAVFLDQRSDAVLQEVVAEVHDEWRVAKEGLGGQYRVRQTARCVLLEIGDAGSESRTVFDAFANFIAGFR